MGPCAGSSLRALLETLEDPGASPGVLTDGLLTLTNRLTGEEGKEFAAEVGKHFPQLYKIFKTHIPTENSELSSAALQALGFCVFNPNIASLLCETEIHELLSILNSVAIKSGDKNTRTRALWVISKQSFPPHIVGKSVPSTIAMLETVLHRGDLHSMVVEYEALNVIIRLIEQAPSHMEEQAVKWAKLIIPLVVHSAHKVQLRGATALEMGVPLLQKHPEVAAVTEELMTIKVIPELQKLFSSKHETYVLKLWPLFVKLLGKALHRSGSFINSLLQLEELGFRSGSPVVKKIAFIAWKSLIDNFALNPEILCSTKRLKLLMQPLSSIHVRTETLALTKLEVWWYLLMRLGPQLPAHFEQVCVPLIQSTLSLDVSLLQGNSSRLPPNQSLTIPGSAQKSGVFPFGNAAGPRMSLNSSTGGAVAIPSIQLLGIEMLLHFFMGPEVLTFAKENNIVLSLEPLQYPVITSPSFFCKHASVFLNAAQDGFIAIGKDASDVILTAIWKEIIGFVKAAIESGNKRERQSSEILTTLLQTLKNIILSKELPVLKSLSLIEVAIKELPPKVLGSPAYQVADMDLLNGTPALFLIQISFCEDLLKCGVQNERFFLGYESLVEYVLSGPTSPLAFSESVLTIVNQSALHLENKEHLWRIWSIVVNPLTEWIKQTNEVNQGDALEHNFSAIYCALLLPVKYIFPSSEFPQPIMKTLLRSWSELYRAFARCALLVATAEDNLCCDELCAKIISGLEDEAHLNQSMLDGLSHITSVMVECINFAPYDKKYQPTNRSPQTPVDWAKRKKDPLGKLSSLIKLLVILINSLQMLASKESGSEQLAPVGSMVVGVLQNIIGHISLPSVIRSVFGSITKPLAALYEKTKSANTSRMTNGLNNKFEKLLAESITCLQSHYTGSFNSELLEELSPLLSVMLLNKNKQVCSQAAQFWNATFGKAVNLAYPEELKSVLYKAKQKFILLLPAFESCEIMDECNVTYSDYTENSQWDANISGITVKPNGKRDSLLAQTNEPEEKSINSHITPAKMKLEFSVSKPNRKNMLLEEENTVDFVFIPPETKERVLTEHQKEVLRTKRVDIPVMYNNLDASQDATLFSQNTQNQEDSLEKPAVVDMKEERGKKENKLTPQNGEATSHQLVIPNEVIGNYKSNVSPERISFTTTEEPNILRKQKWDMKNEELNVCVPVQSSTLDTTLNENPSNCSSSSSSSVSSDIISGTPQPVSRRQSFITLEKFDGLENRPFSPSVFSNNSVTSGSIPSLVQKESTIVSDVSSTEKSNTENKDALKLRTEEAVTRTKRTCLEVLNAVETCVKAKKTKENNANPKLQSNSMIGITKSSLRQNKRDSSEDKNSKQMQSDQEGRSQVSDKRWEDKHELPVDVQVAEHLLDNRSPVPSVSVTGSTAMESKPLLDTVPERNAGPDLEHKENTPPEIDVYEEAISNVNQSTDISLNQKALRRSLRRKPETDGTVDSQDKENNQQKKDRRKDDEKILPKKMTQNRETSGQKEKAIPEKTIAAPISVPVSNATDGVNSKECHTSGNIQEQLSTNIGKSEGSPASDTEESGPDPTGEKPKVFPRYHTRRASQGLLTSIENSESDSSETREEGTKRKRSRKLKKNDSPGNQVKGEPENQELCSQTTVEIQTTSVGKHKIHSEGEMEVALIASNSKEISTKEEKNTLPLSSCLDLKENTGTTHCRASSDPERKLANRIESTSEPILESRQETSILDTNLVVCNNSNGVSEEDASATAISALPSSKKLLDTPECQHKRSRRARRSRSCDCCDEKLSPQVEKLPPELKKASTPEPKLKEHKKMLSKVTVALTSIPTAEDVHLAKRLSAEPCATSTPLPLIKDCADLKEAGHVADSVNSVLRDDTPNIELGKSACVQSESDKPIAGILDSVPFTEAILEPGSVDSPSKEPRAQGQRLESDAEAVAVMDGSGKQSGQLENRIDAEIRINQSEGTRASERVVQTTVEETTVTSAAVVAELQENEMGEEEDAENNTADTPSEPQTSVLLQEKSDNLDSPPKYKELDALSLAKVSGSPTGAQARCIWSPSASPSTSILKRGIKRQQEEDSPSSANKNRRVSFANPIYQEELADDIDRRSPVVRTHPCNGSQSLRSAKFSPNHQAKLITTPTKGSLSPGTRSHKYKSSKKCLITEMVKEPVPTPTESIYPALVACKASVDTILPQITSNIWARGLGQLIRAKNIRTVGDLSSLSAAEIKTLPIRSPKVSNVRKALKGYHEQQVKSRGLEEIAGLDDSEKPLNGMDEKPFSTNEEAIIADVCEPEASSADVPSATDLCAQINLLYDQITSESLLGYSGNELFEMQEKLHSMASCIMRNLKSRWKSPPHESTV